MEWRLIDLVRLSFPSPFSFPFLEAPGRRPSLNLCFPLWVPTDTQSKSVIMNVASEEKTRANDDWFSDSKLDVRYG